ncbi:MAG: hypothetical protein JRI68_30885 [Deltaproteobacteria bacterium]|nr:hypothetical protein [Deltaproteobacteria bacterium]
MVCLATTFGACASLLTTCGVLNDCYTVDICQTTPGLSCDICDLDYQCTDGFQTEDADEAFRYCHCTHLNVECVDGRTATLCWPDTYADIVSDLLDSATFSDGETMRYNTGFAECFGYDACERSLCPSGDQALFMMECVRGADEIHHAWDGRTFVNNYQGSLRYCHGATYEEASKMCTFGIGSCEQLDEADCDEAKPCIWDSYPDPYCKEFSGECSDHEDQTDCLQDPACTWE